MANKTMMSAFKSVFLACKGNGFKLEDADAKKALAQLRKQLGFSNEALIFLACTIGLDNDDEMIGMQTLAQYLGLTKMDILEHSEDVTVLDERGYIVNEGYNQVSVTCTALDDLMHNRPYTKLDTTTWPADAVVKELRTNINRGDRTSGFHRWEVMMNGNKFIDEVDELAKDLVDDELYFMLYESAPKVMRNILVFCVGSYCFGVDDEDTAMESGDFFDCLFYRHTALKDSVFETITKLGHPFMKSGYFEYFCEDGIANTNKIIPTEKFVKRFNLKRSVKTKTSFNRERLLKHSEIAQKELFYDENTANDVERLTNLLSKEHFSGIQQRLKEANLRNGFAVLLYGAPGTGKTETVLQLAKATGRDIMQVNYEDLKSKYVGDSEKEVKRLFAEYAEAVEGSEHAPILLFNEADGLLGKRKQGAENAVDKMENTVQNIILQEMEKLNGIMIATTNLTCNFDSAFERRFLYKIKYDKPGQQVREHIWHSMLGELSDNDVKQLASEYDFSGGEIENIARKQKVEYILSGNSVTLDQIRQFCDREKIVTESGNHKRVGFC